MKQEDDKRLKYEQVQSIIRNYKQKNMVYLPLKDLFVKADGGMNTGYVSGDGIHLLPQGYEVWARALKEVIEKQLSQK